MSVQRVAADVLVGLEKVAVSVFVLDLSIEQGNAL
jgi:hypothetical protein